MWIFLFVILAIIYAINGDTSGIKAIGMIVLFGGAMFVVLAIAAYAPWIPVGLLFIVLVIYANK